MHSVYNIYYTGEAEEGVFEPDPCSYDNYLQSHA